MLPLIQYLPSGGRNRADRTQWANLALIEGVAASRCFGMNCPKICVDCVARRCVRPKARQLRMVPIASCFPAQYRASQQRFAPQWTQALRINVPRVNCPESHVSRWRLTMRLGDAGVRPRSAYYLTFKNGIGAPA